MKTVSDRRKNQNSDDDRSPFSTPTKRRKRDPYHNAVSKQTESFVMKLFDRSLDLSKYTEKTPLYPICRAWIANQPRNPNLIKDQKEPPKRENNGADLLNKIQRGERIIITALPAPLNIEVPSITDIYAARKPNLEALEEALKKDTSDTDTDSDDDDDVNIQNERNRILMEHKEEWKKARRKYKHHSADKRYELNQLLIKKMFKSQ